MAVTLKFLYENLNHDCWSFYNLKWFLWHNFSIKITEIHYFKELINFKKYNIVFNFEKKIFFKVKNKKRRMAINKEKRKRNKKLMHYNK